MSNAGLTFTVLVKKVDEDYPSTLQGAAVAEYIAQKKAAAYDQEVLKGSVVITADTIVVVDDVILGKPADASTAYDMLSMLSGRDHEVITAVCVRGPQFNHAFHSSTKVSFRSLLPAEIHHYIEHYKPYDKAGGYGIQEWIGHIGIIAINGSYDNVVGLPMADLWSALQTLQKAGHL
jgi:septum formation protein